MAQFQIAAGADDGFWQPSTPDFNAATGYLIFDETTDCVNWMRFANLTLPQGSTITAASFTGTPLLADSSSRTFRIQAFAEDDAANPTNLSTAQAKVLTTAYVDWTPGAWTGGTPVAGPDISAVIQEVINRSGWASGNHLAVVISNIGAIGSVRYFTSFEDGRPTALTVTWAGVANQKARPVADVSLGGWTTQAGGTTNLWATLDETVADAADYVQSAAQPLNAELKVRLGAVGYPATASGHIVRYQYQKDTTAGGTIGLVVTLYAANGTTVIAQNTHANIDAVTSGSFTLTSGQALSIPNPDYATGLVIGLSANQT